MTADGNVMSEGPSAITRTRGGGNGKPELKKVEVKKDRVVRGLDSSRYDSEWDKRSSRFSASSSTEKVELPATVSKPTEQSKISQLQEAFFINFRCSEC